jgi:Arc/MetJ-type ribon-helix-helix transcriptional regulator
MVLKPHYQIFIQNLDKDFLLNIENAFLNIKTTRNAIITSVPFNKAKKLLRTYKLFSFQGYFYWFSGTMFRSINDVIEVQAEVQKYESESEVCALAIRLIKDFENRKKHYKGIRDHIDKERHKLDSRRKSLLMVVGQRDGFFCASCKRTQNLCLDHIKSLALGGYTIATNLQLLCKLCNDKKGIKEIDFRVID